MTGALGTGWPVCRAPRAKISVWAASASSLARQDLNIEILGAAVVGGGSRRVARPRQARGRQHAGPMFR